jgi:hypothetical protein
MTMRVFVYFNLHSKVWSIKALEGAFAGRVVAHATYVQLRDVECRVSEAGRQRVLREQRKNVHAGLVGTLRCYDGKARLAFEWDGEFEPTQTALGAPVGAPWFGITYNPYKGPTFVRRDTGEPVLRASRAVLGKGFVDAQS